MTSFVGREVEVATVSDLIARDDVRLLTLTGPGGIGKTRLALEVLGRAEANDARGWFVPLAGVRDPDVVSTSILRALVGADAAATRSLLETVGALVAGRPALLVLDNLEQVVAIGPALVDLLARCPSLTLLATSRVPLRVSPERVWPVPPLALPPDDARVIAQAAAVRLFVDRARAADPVFALNAATGPVVAAICRHLEGLPLAIELAAARMTMLSPVELWERLGSSLSLLHSPARDQPQRLRSMRGSIGWSHDLLDPEEQALLAQLAIFAGGCTLDAAAAIAVCSGPRSVMDVLGSLVASHLVRATPQSDGTMRYDMLEPVREFAEERLAMRPDADAVAGRHARYYLTLAERTDWSWFLPVRAGEASLRQIYADEPNLLTALGWFRQHGDYRSLLRMTGRLGALWTVCGRVQEGISWIEAGLTDDAHVPDDIRAKAIVTLSWILDTIGDTRRAIALAEEALVLSRTLEEPLLTAQCLRRVGSPAAKMGRYGLAIGRYEEAIAILASLEEPAWARNAIITISAHAGLAALMQGDVSGSDTWYQSARARQVDQGHPDGDTHIYGHMVAAGLGDVARARGDPETALRHYQASLEMGRRYANRRAIAYALGGVAGALAARGYHLAAARLFGACEAVHERFGFRFDLDPFDRQRALGLPEPWLRAHRPFGAWQALRVAIGLRHLPPVADPAAVEVAWAEGRQLPVTDAIVEALAMTLPDLPLVALTPREREAVGLLAAGCSDAEIAARLEVSRRTVATHLQHVYGKLGVASRAEAAAVAVRRGLA